MIITHKLKMDLTQNGASPRVSVVQGDTFSRRLAIYLFEGKRPWNIPAGAAALIRYRRPNGDSGIYDTLPDGTGAVSISGNRLSVLLASEALSQPGSVWLMVSIVSATQQLTTFSIELQVQAICGAEETDPQGTAWIASLLRGPDSAAAGQYLVVQAVNGEGRVLSLQAVDLPAVSQEEVQSIVEQCLQAFDFSEYAVSPSHSWEGTVLTITSASGTSSADLKGEDGLTPYIGSNGNWWLGLTDTGVTARGSDATVTVDSTLSTASANPVQNMIVTAAIRNIESALTDTVKPRLTPAVTSEDNGKILSVVDGAWSAVSVAESGVAEYVEAYLNDALGGEY